MLKYPEISQQAFENLLDWLDPNRETAAQKYEALRHGLIKIFTVKKHFDAEFLADLVFDRVCRKLPEISQDYQGKKELYFYGVAKMIHLEAQNQAKTIELQTERLAALNEADEGENEIYYQCLDKCLQKLSSEDRKMVIAYYRNDKSAKIDYRKEIAKEMGITLDNLRIKVFRLRNEIRKCISSCVK